MELKPGFDTASKQLSQSESLQLRFGSAFELVPIALLIAEPSGAIALVNPETEALFGYSADELIDKPFNVLVAERFRHEHKEYGNGFFAIPTDQAGDAGGNLFGLQKSGSEIPIEVKLRAIVHNGRDCILCTVLEMAAWGRSQAQLTMRTAELVESNVELNTFSSLAAHDLQEPLRKIASSLQAIIDDHADKLESDARRWIDYAEDGAKRMQTLLNDLLTFTRFSTHYQPMRLVDPNATLRAALSNLAFAIEESRAQIICHPLPRIVADEKQLVTLLQNLVDNAIRFRGDHEPHIEIGAEVKMRGAADAETSSESLQSLMSETVFYVRDNAIGIAPQYFERIFVAFQRLHSRHQYAGSGLGLAFCKKIVERHGGRIWVESTPTLGSTFYFTWGTNLKDQISKTR